MIPACLGVEWTSGFDSSMMNGIQTIKYWDDCEFQTRPLAREQLLMLEI